MFSIIQPKCIFVMKDREWDSVYFKTCLCVYTQVCAKKKADHSSSECCSGWWIGQLLTTLKKMHLNIWKCIGMLWSTRETFHGKLAGDTLHFLKCQRPLINVPENLLFLHYKPPLINNMNLKMSALCSANLNSTPKTLQKFKSSISNFFMRSISYWIHFG